MKLSGDKRVRSVLLLVVLALFVAACASVATQMAVEDEDPSAQSGDLAADEQLQPAEPPPFVPPPEPSEEQWAMPDIEQRAPTFPYLPGESRDVSRSIGNTSHGWMSNSRRIPHPHPHLRVRSVQYERGLNYTSDSMLELIESAAAHVADKYPETPVPLGNFSAEGGGDIPYSVSHNNGRDGDLGIYVHDADGVSVEPDGFVSLDENGRYDGEHGEYYFDAARNWTLVEGLIRADDGRLQYIFISNPLKRKLLAEGRRQGAPGEILARARTLLHQPGGALPHSDHFHIRIYCSEIDVRSGCVDRGRKVAGYKSHRRARSQTIREAIEVLGADEAEARLAAVRRLGLLEARGAAAKIAERLDDDNPQVRAASARVLGNLGRAEGALAERLDGEEHPQVVVELISALGQIGNDAALEALVAELGESRPIELVGELDTDARAFVAEALVESESRQPVLALIDLLESDSRPARTSAARALRILTNHQMISADELGDDERAQTAAERWREWYEDKGHLDRDEWLACGFRDAGYEVDRLHVNNVWDLCRAVADDDHLSYNAQRVLMRLSGRTPASLSWSKEDANFYWRRWFERRWRHFGAPPIPEELSTLN